jgi:hypothetical protein
MGTRSLIGKTNPDNTYTYIYCHWDSKPYSVGTKLVENYFTNEKVDQLLELGDLSALGEKIGEKQDFNNFETQVRGWCLAYGRDRGEDGREAKTIPLDKLVDVDHWQEYIYIWKDNEWKCYTPSMDELVIPTNQVEKQS